LLVARANVRYPITGDPSLRLARTMARALATSVDHVRCARWLMAECRAVAISGGCRSVCAHTGIL
jgi:hypothetical protein